MIAVALCLAAILAACVAAGRVLTSFLDRIGTVRKSSLPIGEFRIDADERAAHPGRGSRLRFAWTGRPAGSKGRSEDNEPAGGIIIGR